MVKKIKLKIVDGKVEYNFTGFEGNSCERELESLKTQLKKRGIVFLKKEAEDFVREIIGEQEKEEGKVEKNQEKPGKLFENF